MLYFIGICSAFSQKKPQISAKTYVGENGKFYYNKKLPAYFFISTSADENAKRYLVQSKQTPQFANPMYFGNEGKTIVRSPSCVDTVTKKTIMPHINIVFEIYVDGKPPKTTATFSEAKKMVKKGKTYYGKKLKLDFSSKDETSGVEKTYFSVNGMDYQEYTSSIEFDGIKTSEYKLRYFSADHVGNVEKEKEITFFVDITPPEIHSNFSIKPFSEEEKSGEKYPVYPSYTRMYLAAKDKHSGTKKIWYSINGGKKIKYSTSQSANDKNLLVKEKFYKVKIFAEDKLGNQSEKIIKFFIRKK